MDASILAPRVPICIEELYDLTLWLALYVDTMQGDFRVKETDNIQPYNIYSHLRTSFVYLDIWILCSSCKASQTISLEHSALPHHKIIQLADKLLHKVAFSHLSTLSSRITNSK